jgi:hypothetical protein
VRRGTDVHSLPVHQRFAFIVIAIFRQAVADVAEADVIRTIQRDAVPGQIAIGGGKLAAARAGIGGAALQLNVDRGLLANRQADSHTRFIGETLFCSSNLEAPRRQAGRLIAASAVGCYRARCTGVGVPDCHRDIAKGRAGLVRHHAGKARSRLSPRRERPHP